jgi:hypothetical protein
MITTETDCGGKQGKLSLLRAPLARRQHTVPGCRDRLGFSEWIHQEANVPFKQPRIRFQVTLTIKSLDTYYSHSIDVVWANPVRYDIGDGQWHLIRGTQRIS